MKVWRVNQCFVLVVMVVYIRAKSCITDGGDDGGGKKRLVVVAVSVIEERH